MTDMTMNNNGNRKKYLVPLVVLLLCGVALTGAAYAYSSTLTTTGTISEDDDAILLHFNESSTTAATVSTIAFSVNYDVRTSAVPNAEGVAVVTYTAILEDVDEITKYINITSEGTNDLSGKSVNLKAVVTNSGDYTVTMKVGGNDITSADGATVTVGSNAVVIGVEVTAPSSLENMTESQYATWKAGLGNVVTFNVAFTATEISA